MSAFHNGNQDLAVFSNQSQHLSRQRMEGPLQAVAGLSGNARPGAWAWGWSGPPVPNKGSQGRLRNACYRLRFFIFAVCRFAYICNLFIFVMEWISTSTLFQFPIIQFLCLQDMRLVCKEDMIRRRGANREFWRHHAVTSYPAHEQMPRHAPNKAKPAKNDVNSKIIKILSPTTRANCSAPFATAGDHAQNHDPSLTWHLPCFQNLVSPSKLQMNIYPQSIVQLSTLVFFYWQSSKEFF